jgi:hypothetical protein
VQVAAAAAAGGGGCAGPGPAPLSVDTVLSNILYFRVQQYTEQLALTRVLGTLLEAQPQVRLGRITSATTDCVSTTDPDLTNLLRLLQQLRYSTVQYHRDSS